MEKTPHQIEADIYKMVANSGLAAEINGQTYRNGWRPTRSNAEDIVVTFVDGLDGQEQSGVVVINIYVQDITTAYGETAENLARTTALMQLANEFAAGIPCTEYNITKDGAPKSYAVEGRKEHFINLRLKYKRINFE